MYLAKDLFYTVAAQALPDLSRKTSHTSYLSVLDGRDLVVIDVGSGTSALQVVVAPGQRTPAHASAGGKAQLATMSDEQVAALYSGRLPRFTSATITSVKELLAELKAIRRRGFAVSDREWKEEVCAVGVALPRPRGERGASLAIAFPALPAPTRSTIQGIADLLLEKSAEFRTSLQSRFDRSEAGANSPASPGAGSRSRGGPKISQNRPSAAAGQRAGRQRRYGS
jgi:DNA-binding IclR family transcriptional regulator